MTAREDAAKRQADTLAAAPQVIHEWLAVHTGGPTDPGNTLRAYKAGIILWLGWCHYHDVDPVNAFVSDLNRYQTWLRGAPGRGGRYRSERTQARLVATVASLYEHIERTDETGTYITPFRRLDRLARAPRGGETKALPRKDVDRLLEAADSDPTTFLAVWFSLVTTARATSMEHLRVQDLTVEDGRLTVRIRLKGGKTHDLPVPAELADAVDAVRGERTDGPLFIHGNGAAWRYEDFLAAVSRAAETAGLGRVTPHRLRATAITHLLDDKEAPHRVQLLAGHEDVKTTMRYHTQFDEARQLAETMEHSARLFTPKRRAAS